MSYLHFEEIHYQTMNELDTFTYQDRNWYNNPVIDEPIIMNRSVRFKDPLEQVLIFDNTSPPQEIDPIFSFQLASDTIRPIHHDKSITIIR